MSWLFMALAAMLLGSGFFSMSETCMMSLNRYRLRHLIKQGSRGARLTGALLAKTEELLAFILAGNTAINAATTVLVLEICRRLLGDGEYVLALATTSASLCILIFAEILPKVFGARFSERIALVASYAQYTRVLLEISSQMRSYAASVLYELGARYLTSPGRVTMREDILWWASVLTGRSDITKVDYRILHRDTIKKALAELDTLSDGFRMEAVPHKRGRKVEELQFRVIPKSQASLSGMKDTAKNVFDLELVERVIGIGLKRTDAQDLYAVTDEGVLRAAVDHVEQRMKNPTLPPLKSPPAYLRDALKRQYAGAGEGDETLPASPVPRPSLDERKQRLREEWQHHKSAEAKSLFEEMPDADQAEQISNFEAQRLPELAAPIARAWRRDGTKSRIAASTFFRWLAGSMWPGEVTDKELLEFAMAREA